MLQRLYTPKPKQRMKWNLPRLLAVLPKRLSRSIIDGLAQLQETPLCLHRYAAEQVEHPSEYWSLVILPQLRVQTCHSSFHVPLNPLTCPFRISQIYTESRIGYQWLERSDAKGSSRLYLTEERLAQICKHDEGSWRRRAPRPVIP